MARIRTVKPELFRHEELFEAETKYQLPLRIAFVGLFTCCDREGRFRWKPKQLKLDILPYDVVDMAQVLNALVESGFIIQYQIDGEQYGCIPSWNKHQYLNHREAASVLPGTSVSPVFETSMMSDDSVDNACVTDPSPVPHPSATHPELPGGNGKGIETGTGREKEGNNRKLAVAQPPVHGPSTEVWMIFSHWKKILQHPEALLDKKREQIIIQALQSGYTVSQLCQAVTGCSKTPHNMGENEQGQRYDGLHLIFRDADQIERFIANCHNPPSSANATDKLMKANISAGQQWLKRKLSETTYHD